MYIKQQNENDPYVIVISKAEMKEAFRNPVSYELFKQTLISKIIMIYNKENEE